MAIGAWGSLSIPRIIGFIVALTAGAAAHATDVRIATPKWDARGQLDSGPNAIVHVPIDGRDVAIRLRPHSIRDPRLFAVRAIDGGNRASEFVAAPARTVRGEALDGSRIRLAGAILDDGLHALIIRPDGTRIDVKPLVGGGPDRYSITPAEPARSMGTCGVDSVGPAGGVAGDQAFGPPLNQTCVARLGCDADFQYFQHWGSNVQNVIDRIELVTNVMNLQFERDVGITHQITAVLVRTAAGAPYTSSVPLTLLTQFKNEWNNVQVNIIRDVAELFTGKNLSGTTIGLAWDIGEVCSISTAYCLCQSDFDPALACATDLSAHELGHLWGATHCTCTAPPSTMNPLILCANTFQHSTSFAEIINYAEIAACLQCEPVDCNANGIGDADDIDAGTSADCNGNYVPDECELAAGGTDCNGNGVLDDCDTGASATEDCDGNGFSDACDLASGASSDINANDIPDNCEPDCNGNGLPDSYDITQATSVDCNTNFVPDECDIAATPSLDCDTNGLIDQCEVVGIPDPDCNDNGVLDLCDIALGTSTDFDRNGLPDSCDPDCNQNGFPDGFDIAMGISHDCNADGIVDECQSSGGTSPPVTLNTDAAIDPLDDLSAVVAGGADGWVAVWRRFGGALGADGELLFARSGNGGGSWTAPSFLLATAASSTLGEGAPRITSDGTATFVVAWASAAKLDGSAGSTPFVEIHAVRSVNGGATWSPPFYVHANALADNNDDNFPDIATDGAGTYVAVWQCKSLPGSEGDIAVSRSTDGGVTWSPKAALNANAATDSAQDIDVRVASGGNGRWLAVWSYGPTSISDAVASLSVNDGVSWSPPFSINPAPGETPDRYPQVAGDGAGGFVVAWSGAPTGSGAIKAKIRSSPDGVTWGPITQLSTPGPSDFDLSMAIAGDQWRVVWRNDGQGAPFGTDKDVFYVRSDDAGASWSPVLPILTTAASDGNAWDAAPNVAAHGDVMLVVFESSMVAGTDRDVRAVQLAFPDCNANAIADWCDIAGGASVDRDGNGVPDDCPDSSAVFADLTGDGLVNASDLAVMLGQWGTPGTSADLNHDAIVGPADLALLLGAWTTGGTP